MNEFNLSSTTLDEIQNHDDFRVVWCSEDNYVSNELTYFAHYLEKCDSIDTCKNYIREIKSERKILLVLINLFKHVAEFVGLSQIQSIYILEKDHQNIHYDKENFSESIHIFTNESLLIDRLRHDILLTYRNDLPISVSYLDEIKHEQSFINSDTHTYLFLWNQLFFYLLVNSDDLDMNKLKTDMIQQCQLEYNDNTTQLNHIKEFNDDCTEDNVLEWYTKDTFAYRLLNKAFRKRDIDLICKFRYFIILLHRKLKELSIKQQGENLTIVYRGQILGMNELESLKSNVGRLISINTFISTTRHEKIARSFIIGAELGVIFHINITRTSYNILHPFANISEFSAMPREEEILFSAGGVFRIDSVEKENDSMWIVNLTLNNKTVEQMERFMDGVKEQMNYVTSWDHLFMKINDLLLFGKCHKILINKSFSWKDIITTAINIDIYNLLTVLGDYRNAIEYYKQLLLEEHVFDDSQRIVTNIIIGNNYFHLKEYDNAEIYYSIALSLLDNNNNPLVGEIYNLRGDIYIELNDLQIALTCYNDALKIFTNQEMNTRYVARVCRKISDIYRRQNNHADASFYATQADEIDQELRQRSELDIETSLEYFRNQLTTKSDHSQHQRADLLYSIGICLLRNNKYRESLEIFLEAARLLKTHLPTSDNFNQKFCTLYDSMALIHFMSKDYFKALIMLKKSIDIRISSYSN
ncbi:unnamed protein product [Adineta steineri]|uniref:NAD(P)(+)--arginine ADP-ribosyltransferase n=1 Tax=Adineta steineri TaxID=433720 RepID=A0A814TYY2_9BILA|nr:unnamed protein product [Adineta steineri]CAF4086745.1 unnamed protein product [Adineta steineri]